MRACRYCMKCVPATNPPMLTNFCNQNCKVFWKRHGPKRSIPPVTDGSNIVPFKPMKLLK